MVKKYVLYAALLLMITTVAIPIGGGSKIYISDISIVFVSILYVIALLQKKSTITKQQKITVISMGIMISYLLCTAGYHTLQNGFNSNNVLLIRNFYMAFFMLFFASQTKITSRMIENTLLIFISASNLFQLGYFALNSTLRTSPLFYTVVLYNLVAIIMLGFLFHVWFESGSRLNRSIASINILSIVLFVPLTGSRSSIVLVFLFTAIYSVLFSLRNGKKGIKKLFFGIILVSVLSGTILLGLVATNNTKGLDTIARSLGIKREGLSTLPSSSQDTENKQKTSSIDDGSRSDAYRKFINNKADEMIQKDFILGAGEIHVEFYDNTKTQKTMQPHNFVLEALLGYGLIGTIIFFTILLLPFVLKETRFRKAHNLYPVFLMLTSFLIYAWTQPSLNRMLPLQIYFLIYLYYFKLDRNINGKSRKRKTQQKSIINTEDGGKDMVNNDNMLRELQLIMLKNMKIIHQICVDNNIKYSLCGGSAVGALIHDGFVPWDDDIDIMMDRLNYERFCRIMPKMLPSNLELINYKNSSDMRTLISKIVDKDYQVTYQTSTGEKIDMGLYVDITVLDKIPVDEKKQKKLLRRSRLGLLLIGRNAPKNQGILKRIIGFILVNLTTEGFKTRFGKKTEDIMKKGVRKDEDFIYGELLIYWGKLHKYDNNMFDSYQLVTFEDAQFYIVSEYDRYLWTRYERDYHILPPKEEQVPHHGILAVKRVQ